MCVRKSLFPSLGRCREEPWSWKEDAEALELFSEVLLFFKLALQPSCFLQIHPAIYCSPCFSFLLPGSDFWPAFPQEGAFGRRGGSCRASECPSGSLPASRWMRLKLTLSRAPQMRAACALTWDELLNRSQPRSFLRLWQGTETSCFLSRFQAAPLALRREGWTRSSSFLRAELARFCPLSTPLAGEDEAVPGGDGAAVLPSVKSGGRRDKAFC